MTRTGMVGTRFQICPQRPNCVSTMANIKDEVHFIAPLTYLGSRESAQRQLEQVLQALPRHKLIKKNDTYWHYEFRSATFRFVDNVEFYFPPREKVIHMRSAAEMGYSDMGVNRQRLESIRETFAKVNAGAPLPQGL